MYTVENFKEKERRDLLLALFPRLPGLVPGRCRCVSINIILCILPEIGCVSNANACMYSLLFLHGDRYYINYPCFLSHFSVYRWGMVPRQ